MILVSKFMVRRALSDQTYLSLGLLSPLILLWVESYHNTSIYFINKMYEGFFFNNSYMPTVEFTKVPNKAFISNTC